VRAKLTYSEASHHAEYNPVRGGVGFLRPSGQQAVTVIVQINESSQYCAGQFPFVLVSFFYRKDKNQTFRIPQVFQKLIFRKAKKFCGKFLITQIFFFLHTNVILFLGRMSMLIRCFGKI
jgi:hypothetical protein